MDPLIDSIVNPGSNADAALGRSTDPLIDSIVNPMSAETGRMGLAFEAGIATPPDRAARVIRAQSRTGLPAEMIEQDLDRVEMEMKKQDFNPDKFRASSPMVAEWMAKNPQNAAIAQDDLDNLSKIESSVKDYGFITNMHQALDKGLASALYGVTTIPELLINRIQAPTREMNRLLEDSQPLMVNGVDVSLKPTPLPDPKKMVPDFGIGKRYKDYADSISNVDINASTTEEISKGNFVGAGRSFAAGLVSNAPQMAAMIAATIAGGPNAGSAFAFLTSSGSKLQQNLDQGIEPGLAGDNALATGAIEVAAENLPLGTLGILKKQAKSMTATHGLAATREVFMEGFKTLAKAYGSEGAEEAITSVAQDLTDWATDVNPDALEGMFQRASDSFIIGGGSGVAMTLPAAKHAAATRSRELRSTAAAMDFYNALGTSAEASKLRQRLPEAQRELVDQITKGTGVENVYVPVSALESYFQSKGIPPAQIAQELGIVEAFNEAKESGADIKVPLATWTGKFVGTEHYQGLRGDVKFSPEARTFNEIQAEKKQIQEDLAKEEAAAQQAEAAAQADQERIQVEEDAKQVEEQISSMLEATGKFDKNQIKQYARLFRERYAARAENRGLGETALGLFQRQNLDLVAPNQVTETEAPAAAQMQEPDIFDEVIASYAAEIPEDRSPEEKEMLRKQKAESKKELLAMAKQALIAIPDVSRDAVADALGLPRNEVRMLRGAPKRNRAIAIGTYSKEEIIRAARGQEEIYAQAAPALAVDSEPAPAFYSRMVQTVEQKMGGSATVDQINGMLREIKPEERKWMGLDEFLKGKEKVSKEELLTHLRGSQVEIKEVVKGGSQEASAIESLPSYQAVYNEYISEGLDADSAQEMAYSMAKGRHGGASDTEAAKSLRKEYIDRFGYEVGGTKFHSYTLPGGENYREVLFTLPESKGMPEGYKLESTRGKAVHVIGPDGTKLGTWPNEESAIKAFRREDKANYRSSHFDEANVLAHTRLNDRVDADGKKVLFVEEIQSDWHQEGRKKGYKGDTDAELAQLKAELSEIQNQVKETGKDASGPTLARATDIMHRIQKIEGTSAVPDAPFRKTWHEFVMKRLIREAAEKGYDRIAWTTGDQQADRYDLAKQVDEVQAKKNKDGTYKITVIKGDSVVEDVPSVKEADLEAQLGKDLAAKIIAQEGKETVRRSGIRSYKGVDLKVGGEGMKGFYDKILVDFANKFGKKYGAKVGEATLPSLTFEQIQANGGEQTGQQKVHSLEITPQLKEAALNEGFSLFQSGQSSPRGRILFGNGQNIIQLFEESDASTVLHEAGHLWLEELITDATTEGVNPNLVKDLDSVLEWMGLDVRASDGRAAVKKAIQTDQHELWARGFEAYLMEGKAPSQALRKAFARFKLWLTRIYRNVRGLDVELNDSVRRVFDRLLVGESATDSAEAELAFDPLFADPQSMGMNETQAKRYEQAMGEARQAAVDKIQTRIMADLQREQEKWWQQEKEAVRREVVAEVEAMPEYRALDIIRNGLKADGATVIEAGEVKISREIFRDQYGEEILKTMPKGVFGANGEGLPPDVVAESVGLRDGGVLIKSLANLPEKEAYIDQLTDERMKELFPDIVTSEELLDVAKGLAMGEERSKVLRMELEHLASNNLPVLKDAIRRITKKPPTEEAVRRQAEAMINKKQVKEISPRAYQVAATKAAKEAGVLLAKGDIDGAFEAKRRQLLNIELHRAAENAIEQKDKALERFKKLRSKDKDLAQTRDTDLINAARAILTRYGLDRAEKTAEEYLAPMKAYDPEMYANVSEIVNGAIQNAKPYKELSFDDFIGMADLVDAIWELSKSTREMEINGVKVSRDQVKAEISARLAETGEVGPLPGTTEAMTDKEKRIRNVRSLSNLITRVESWAYAMDKGQYNGAFQKYLVRPVLEAATRYRLAKVEALKTLAVIVQDIKIEDPAKKIEATEIGYRFTKPELLMALLHNGNESNLKKLLLGRGWGEMNPDGSLDTSRWDAFLARAQSDGTITKGDWEAVQKIWDLNESLKPAAQKAHKKMYGFYFNEITARKISTPFGDFKGGYMPAIADQSISMDANIRAGQSLDDNPAQMFPTTGRGFTKARENNYSTPLSLDFTKIQNHVDKVLKFSHIEPAVKDAARLVNDRDLRAQLNAHTSEVANDLLLPWLKRAATQKTTTPGFSAVLDRGLSWFRRTSSIQFMVANVTNSIQNTTGLFPAMTRVNKKELAGSFKRYMTDRRNYSAEVQEASAYMRSRIGQNANEILKEIDDVILNPSKFEKFKDSAITHGYVFDRMTNGMVEVVVWGAAYNQAIAEKLSHQDAVGKADSTVRQTLAAMNPEDVSRYETGSPFVKLFSMFSGFFNTQANLLKAELTVAREEGLTTKEGALRATRAYTYVVALPAIVSALIMRAMAGEGLDEDDDGEYFDDVMDMLFGSQFRYLVAFAPGGAIVNNVVNRFNEKPYDDKISVSPALSNLEKSLGAARSVPAAFMGGSVSKAIKEGLAALGLATGLPLTPLAKPLGYLAEVEEGKAKPSGPIDAIRGAATGKRGSEK